MSIIAVEIGYACFATYNLAGGVRSGADAIDEAAVVVVVLLIAVGCERHDTWSY